eukprot:CAMPEP_0178754814 /NCGR_PEP_ID=MMETSP0744-20121128/12368_1 /TAXON_ID=913974 /ORGANISM="Nitzschia punctata, Strain CCMP561" /LENGTH=205 /DNA_ID=CAMNT_0020408767 /DNA_START=41 /DNA_END=658 /DNA_ORIENTATION=-
MIAATFAYILAYQLHLKRQANQKLEQELQQQRQEQQTHKTLLRSLLDEAYIQDVALAITEELSSNNDNTITNNKNTFPWPWSQVSRVPAVNVDAVARMLHKKLEERIGDEGLDDEIKKERNIERIWQENRKKMERKMTTSILSVEAVPGSDNNNDGELEEFLVMIDNVDDGEDDDEQESSISKDFDTTSGNDSTSRKQRKRVFDM